MYPTVKFIINTELDLENLIISLDLHYSNQYFKRLLDDYMDNVSELTVYTNESIKTFFSEIESNYLTDLELCLKSKLGELSDENRKKYLDYYFTQRTSINREIDRVWFLLFKSHRINP